MSKKMPKRFRQRRGSYFSLTVFAAVHEHGLARDRADLAHGGAEFCFADARLIHPRGLFPGHGTLQIARDGVCVIRQKEGQVKAVACGRCGDARPFSDVKEKNGARLSAREQVALLLFPGAAPCGAFPVRKERERRASYKERARGGGDEGDLRRLAAKLPGEDETEDRADRRRGDDDVFYINFFMAFRTDMISFPLYRMRA